MKYAGISPMLRHALESFEHGMFHYYEGGGLDRKFALLHVDQAIELITKEKLVRTGKSIFKSDGKTLSLHETLTSLDRELSFPERPRLEELHDLRNTVQHRGIALDEFATQFYITEAYSFVERFLRDELGIELQDFLPPELILSRGEATLFDAVSDRMQRIESIPKVGEGVSIPVQHQIVSGNSEATQPPATFIQVKQILSDYNPDRLFAFAVSGDSMADALLHDGDIVIVHRQEDVEDGQMAIVRISETDETMAKRVYHEGKKIRLQPANPLIESALIIPKEDLRIEGRMVMVVRELPRGAQKSYVR